MDPASFTPREALNNGLLRWLRSHFYRWRGAEYGMREALLWSTALDTWYRYAAVVQALEPRVSRESTILEVGPGWVGLEFFLPSGLWPSGRLVQTDIVRWPVRRTANGPSRLLASGSALPLRDASFDFVVGVDVLEHVPRDARGGFCEELERVARTAVILHVPLDGEDGRFEAARCDAAFQAWFETRFGRREPNVEEHIRAGQPKPQELEAYLPGVALTPTQSVEDWLWYIHRQRVPALQLLFGLRAYLRESVAGPPWYSALAVWEKPA